MTALLRFIAKSLAALAVIACATLPACSARSEERVLETWYLVIWGVYVNQHTVVLPLGYPSLSACETAAQKTKPEPPYGYWCVPHHF